MMELRQTHFNAVFMLAAALVFLEPYALATESSQNPSPENTVFGNEVGTWETEIYTWPNGNLDQPKIYKGVEVNKLLLDDNSLHRTHTVTSPGGVGTVSDVATGNGLTLQFDPKKVEYIGRWDSNSELKSLRPKGKFDKETKTLTLVFARQGTEQQGVEKRLTTRYINADTKEERFSLVQFVDGEPEIFTVYKTIAKRKKD